MTTTIVPDAFVFTEWPSKRLDNKDDTGKSEEAPARDLCRCNNQLYSEMPVSEAVELRALCFFSVYLLPLFASCLHPLESGIVSGRRSRQINNPQADTKFTRTTISKKTKNKQKQNNKKKKQKNADLAKKHLV